MNINVIQTIYFCIFTGTGFAQSRYQSIKEKDKDKHPENNT